MIVVSGKGRIVAVLEEQGEDYDEDLQNMIDEYSNSLNEA